MARHNEIGKWGENLAEEYLIAQGYAITERNWRLGHFEIDIIAMKGNRIIFVEVKTRADKSIDPTEAIDEKKIRRTVRSANAYITSYNIPHEPQFDIIAISGTPEDFELRHIPDAFMAPLNAL